MKPILGSSLLAAIFFLLGTLVFLRPVAAATCSVTTDTVVTQTYVNDNACTAIDITNNVSTTWIGTVDLGGGIVTVKTGNTMTMGVSGQMILGAADDLVIESGAVLSHIEQNPTGLTVTARNITVTGSINTDVKGCMNTGGIDGSGPNSSNVCTVATAGFAWRYGGASHGGLGGSGYYAGPGAIYGSSTYPVLLGSSGGNGNGGTGGGQIFLIASGAVTVSGSITANGGLSASGGSIYISAHTFVGSGTISANGGNQVDGNTGAGGGGRIALYSSDLAFSGTLVVSGGTGSGPGMSGTTYTKTYTAPSTPSLTSPIAGSYNASINPTLGSSIYDNSPDNLTHLSTDWKVTSDSVGASAVWSSLGDTDDLSSIVVNASKGTFAGALAGQSTLAASTTYYAFVRHANTVGGSSWSIVNAFTTLYVGASSTQSWNFDDVTPAAAFAYNATDIEVNASSNGYARLKDLGAGTYAATPYPGWSNYKVLTITNANASILTDMQVKVTVDYVANMQSTFADVRFSSSDGTTDISYWLESKTDGVSAVFWVKIPSLAASATTDIRMYYGNLSVVSTSSGTSTFAFFDDFNDGDYTGWTATHEGGGVTTVSAATGKLVIGGTGGFDQVIATGYSATDVVIETIVIANDESANNRSQAAVTARYTNDNNLYTAGFDLWETGDTAVSAKRVGGGWAQLSQVAFTNSSGVAYKIKYIVAGTSQKFYVDDVLKNSTTDASLSSAGMTGFNFDLGGGGVSDTMSADDYRIRQYAASDPTVSFGSEQVAGVFADIILVPTTSNPEYAALYRIEEDLMPGSTGLVYYQFSTDNSTWNYWNGSTWAAATDSVSQTNTFSTVNSYLPLFQTQVGTGTLYTRVIFVSNGAQPVGLDAFRIFYTPLNVAPDAPTLLGQPSLVDGSTTSTATPTFSFTLNDLDGADTVKYQIQIDDSADFGSPIIDYTSDLAVQGEQSFQVGQVGSYAVGDGITLSNGSYYWQVKAIDENAAASSYETANAGAIAFAIDVTSRYLSFESVTGSGLESVTATSVRILLNAPHFENVTTTYSIITASTTAEGAGTDYTLATGEAMIPAGETSTTISLMIGDDDVDELNETIGIELSSPINALIGSNTSTFYTILDNDTAGVTITQVSGPLAVTEGGIADAFTVVLDSAPTSTIQISFSTSTYGLTLSTSTLTFTSSDWNVIQTVYVTGTNDAVYEGTHATSIQPLLTTSAYAYGYEGLGISSFIGTITDNDSAGIVFLQTAVDVTEGGTTDTYSVVLDSEPTSTVQVLLSPNAQVTVSAPSISFDSSNWSVPFEITVEASNDSIDEPSQVVDIVHTVVTTAYGYADLELLSVEATVTDNDTAGITFTDSNTLAVTEGLLTDTFQVVLTTAPAATVQILFATTTNGVTLSTSTIDFTSLNWNVPVEVTVTATDDTVSEGAHVGTITPTVSTTAYGYSSLLPAIINATITDDDSAGVSVSKTSASVTEGRATDSYTIVLTTAPTSTVEISLAASNARLSLSASILTFTASDWSTPQTVTISTVDDTSFQSNQTGTISHVASSTGIGYLPALSISSVTVAIQDSDNPGGGASSAGGGGGGGAAQNIFSLTPAPEPVVTTAPVVIIVAPAQNVTIPPPAPVVFPGQQVVTILNPTDIKSLVQATNGSRDFASEAKSAKLLTQDAREFRVPLNDEQNLVLANFVTYGISERTRNLGSGERRALIRDALQTMKTGTVSPSDLERLARGMKPEYRNLSAEIAQLPRVRQTFQAIYGHLPNFKDPSEDLAWNALMYRIRFPRDLKEEAQGIQEFKKLFKKSPSDPFQWAAVRVLGYVKPN